MEYLAIIVLTIGTLGIVFSKKEIWGTMGGRFLIFNTPVTLIDVAGWILCIVAFKWWGLLPIGISAIVANLLIGNRKRT